MSSGVSAFLLAAFVLGVLADGLGVAGTIGVTLRLLPVAFVVATRLPGRQAVGIGGKAMSMEPQRGFVRRVAALVAATALLASVLGAHGGSARQVSETEGFRLVARVLPAEWTALAATMATPEAGGPATPGPVASPAAGELLNGRRLVAALRSGGYVIYFRHASTDSSETDSDLQDLADCSTQRNLDEDGRTEARAIGAAFRALEIPVGDVLSSEYCRTRETAELAFGRVTPTRDLTSRAATTSESERAERIEALRRLLSTPPQPGVNTVLVGHNFNLQDATGIAIAEGEAAIFLPRPSE